jgi:serine protease
MSRNKGLVLGAIVVAVGLLCAVAAAVWLVLSGMLDDLLGTADEEGGTPVASAPFVWVIDPEVEPIQSDLPSFDQDSPRTAAAVVSPDGQVASFVDDEVLLQSDDPGAVQDLLDRTGGELLYEFDPAVHGGVGLAPIHLIRVDRARLSRDSLSSDAEALAVSQDGFIPDGTFRFSSEAGAGLLGLVLSETRGGSLIGVNWIGTGNPIPDDSMEAPVGPAGADCGPYSRNAYDWVYFAAGTVQDIGVTEAWSVLEGAGLLDRRVKIAILDMGFWVDDDFRSPTVVSVVPGVFDPIGRSNLGTCTGGNPCPWHGTSVASTAMAIPDNYHGAAGVAGPIAEPVLVFTYYDSWHTTNGLWAAYDQGARIMNMSYSWSIPSPLGLAWDPVEHTTQALQDRGVLLFAAAGNDGENVDYEHCDPIRCWEDTWHVPCECLGVICVGGLATDREYRDSGSNHGSGNVDIYAPFRVFVGPDPDNTANQAHCKGGTSYSSPFAAGVAALIWAANPEYSAGEVWDLMEETAQEYYGTNRVNAFDAVLAAAPPSLHAEITSPSHGSSHEAGQPVSFAGQVVIVSQPGPDVRCRVQWIASGFGTFWEETVTIRRTSEEGVHARAVTAQANDLPAGERNIRLAVAGLEADFAEETFEEITVEIGNSPPVVVITQPNSTQRFCEGDSIRFRGDATDPNEVFTGGLDDSAFLWISSLDWQFGWGRSYETDRLQVGSHTITLRATDPQGLSGEVSIYLTILPRSDEQCAGNQAPHAEIVSPDDWDDYSPDGQDEKGHYATVTFQADASDPEDGDDVMVEWYSDVEGSLGAGRGLTTITVRLHAYGGPTTHTITLIVTDNDDGESQDRIHVKIQLLI